jgi:hypothetical protein
MCRLLSSVSLFDAGGAIVTGIGFDCLISFKECAIPFQECAGFPRNVMRRGGFALSSENALRRAPRLGAFVNHDDLELSCVLP